MDFADLLGPDHIVSGLKATSKKQALHMAADHIARVTGLDARTVFDGLLERERLGSTGVGAGAAIPHGKFDGSHCTTDSCTRDHTVCLFPDRLLIRDAKKNAFMGQTGTIELRICFSKLFHVD